MASTFSSGFSIFVALMISTSALAADLRNKRQTTVPVFAQSSYSFTVTSCAAGSTIGQVFASVSNGVISSYQISSSTGQFAVSSTGIITLTSSTATSQTFTVTAYSSTGGSAVTSVTVTASCSSSSSSTSYTSNGRTAPVWQQSSYAFTVACSRRHRVRPGLIWATNNYSDTLNYSLISGLTSVFFVDPNSGEVKSMIPVPNAGSYSVTAQASDPYGNTSTVPITITVTGTC